MKYFSFLILTILLWPTALLAAGDTCICYNEDNGCVELSIPDEIDCQDTCLADYTDGNGSVVEASDPGYTGYVEDCLTEAGRAAGGNCFCYEDGDCEVLGIYDEMECDLECADSYEYFEPTDAEYNTALFTCEDTHTAAIADEPSEPIIPNLSVNIPNLSFSPIAQRGDILEVNFLGEYVVALYKWLLSASIIIATVMIIIGGVQYMTGSPDKALKRIRGAVTGLMLLMGGYVILFTVNPDMTFFEPLKLKYVFASYHEEDLIDASFDPTLGKLCDTHASCEDWCDATDNGSDRDALYDAVDLSSMGIAAPEDTVPIPTYTGIETKYANMKIAPEAVEPLKRAADKATARNLSLYIVSSFRPLHTQLELACDEIIAAKKAGRTPNIPSAVAWPGGSPHGTGGAVDLKYKTSDGNVSWNVNYYSQADVDASKVGTLAEIMYDAGWHRYTKEIWHFQIYSGGCTTQTIKTYSPSC
jgi:LAS superfamily LD-carboxypeptidase LdcB